MAATADIGLAAISIMPVRILIVDDHEVVRVGLRTMIALRGAGWKVCGEAADGIAGVAKAAELAPDVVILDLEMPFMNGLEAAKKIRRVAPRTKIILFSAYDTAPDLVGCVDEFVSKFSEAGELPQAIERVANLITPGAPSGKMSAPAKRTKGRAPSFEIFRGQVGDHDAAWLESVEGLAAARQRMERIGAEKPGAYFVFSIGDRVALASIDTSPQREAPAPADAKGVA